MALDLRIPLVDPLTLLMEYAHTDDTEKHSDHGVAAIAAVGMVRASIQAGLEREGAALLGGDAEIQFTYRFAREAERALAASLIVLTLPLWLLVAVAILFTAAPSAARSPIAPSASRNPVAWNRPMGWPNWRRAATRDTAPSLICAPAPASSPSRGSTSRTATAKPSWARCRRPWTRCARPRAPSRSGRPGTDT